MLRSYVPLGAAVALCLATSACVAPSSDATAAGLVAPPPPEVEAELALSVDALDVRHGSLRIEASMVDGSADVSMWLGPTCETREVGRGFATRSGFTWSLSREELARAIECNLVVRSRGVDEDGQRVRWTATLPVAVGLVPDGAEEVRILRQESIGRSTKMVFASPARADRVHIAGTVIGSEPDEEKGPKGLYVSAFMIGNDDLALSAVSRRRLTLLGDGFLATVSIGSMTLDVSEPEPEVVEPPALTESEVITNESPRNYRYHRDSESCDDCDYEY